MDSVIATGKRNGAILTVVVSKENNDISITFNGVENKYFQTVLMQKIKDSDPVGGTYWLKTTDLFAYNKILKESFFDELINIIVEGKLDTMPYKKGVIY